MLQHRRTTAAVKTILLSGGGHTGLLGPPAWLRGSKPGLEVVRDKFAKFQEEKAKSSL